MPLPYSGDLRWRIVWLTIAGYLMIDVAKMMNISFCTVYRYVNLFYSTGDVIPASRNHGPLPLLGDYKQIVLYN